MIKPFVTATALALVLTLLSPAAQADTPDPLQLRYLEIPIQETGVVDLVADGDTFRFIENGTSEYVTIRLLGVNTPEVRGGRTPLVGPSYLRVFEL